ncbi:nitroreductase [Paenibacillus crassostreae]|uniref:Nitroreductase n=2 Tax=Paenibacillus crassostreae TaxID=1763538 RepID=A0A167G3Z6_9BACL|nr:nitroreductase family protein [Paenibacillus crassostreae]AOZ94834.1 nitroreductase [Paenibacillus crassostreae]OAB77191.1 nitroreductase [Paenibacillus crassostreae]
MDVYSAINIRREITKFKDTPIPKDILEKLSQALYMSPTGNNLPSREFIQITNKAILTQLSTTTPYVKWLQEATAAIVITGSPDVSKYWLQDASIAGGYLWLAAVSSDLGAAWGAVYHSEDYEESSKREGYVRGLLGIPDHLRVVVIIGLGYPAVEPAPKDMIAIDEVLHLETY